MGPRGSVEAVRLWELVFSPTPTPTMEWTEHVTLTGCQADITGTVLSDLQCLISFHSLTSLQFPFTWLSTLLVP